ncbi:hypothetical protein, partial [Enterobacter hormaechei]|uniref:hypothetical protein n=1 Tax=Enterobacter hormaechei TaxID=158836 RepID=UPI001CC2CBC4
MRIREKKRGEREKRKETKELPTPTFRESVDSQKRSDGLNSPFYRQNLINDTPLVDITEKRRKKNVFI